MTAPRSLTVIAVCAALAAGSATTSLASAAPTQPGAAHATSHARAAVHDIDAWSTVVAGISVRNERWTTRDDASPERSSLMRVDLTNKHLSGNVYSAYRVTNGPYQQLREMMGASGAVGGINGDFFDLSTSTGQTVGGLVRSGAIWKTPYAGFNANFYLRADGSAGIGPVTVTGSVRVPRVGKTRGYALPLVSVNKLLDAKAGRLTLITPTMAGTSIPANCTIVTAKVAKGTVATGATVTVTSVKARTRRDAYLPQLAARTLALVGCADGTSANASTWLRTALPVKRSATITVGFTGLRPTALVSGAQVLVQDGKGYRDPHPRKITDRHAETFACVSRDARHLLLGTIDMNWEYWQWESGVSMNELRNYLLRKGCWSAMAFDGGGSSTLDYLNSHGKIVTVNHPADGQERHIPDALLFYYKP